MLLIRGLRIADEPQPVLVSRVCEVAVALRAVGIVLSAHRAVDTRQQISE
jgi:hypothetical protein